MEERVQDRDKKGAPRKVRNWLMAVGLLFWAIVAIGISVGLSRVLEQRREASAALLFERTYISATPFGPRLHTIAVADASRGYWLVFHAQRPHSCAIQSHVTLRWIDSQTNNTIMWPLPSSTARFRAEPVAQGHYVSYFLNFKRIFEDSPPPPGRYHLQRFAEFHCGNTTSTDPIELVQTVEFDIR